HGMTVIMATQDAEAVARFADRVIVLEMGRIVFSGTPAHLFSQVERVRAWGLAVPQLALLSHLLARSTGKSFTFLRPEQARQALVAAFGSDLETLLSSKSSSSVGVKTRAGVLPRDESQSKPPFQKVPESAGCDTHAEPIIRIDNLSYRYSNADRFALQDTSLCIFRGDWLSIIGINGSGKSTLIKHLNGLLKPVQGSVYIDGQDTRACRIGQLAHTVSYLPQNPDRLIFCATVRDEVAYGPRQLGLRGQVLDDRVTETLDELGLIGFADHAPAVLSYGLRRQVALASVLAMNTPVLALDEPTAGLDQGSIDHLLGVVEQRHKQGATIVTITHDLRLAARYANRVAVLYQGRLVGLDAARNVLADIETLTGVGLDPLPVTLLSAEMHISPPLPLTAQSFVDRLVRFGGGDE
ncbi:MAG: ATP-binding cassette domain-containing protein, partial [Anaerolineae bacterium]|nr:ATP-binding cassette domain-containing protein [Anaerolineae bacterium]